MKKFFIRIDGEQRGPFELGELAAAGVTPSTYVWTKGMEDWEQARNQPDICRYFRQRLSGTLPLPPDPSSAGQNVAEGGREALASPIERLERGEKVRLRDVMQQINEQYAAMAEEQRNPTHPPRISFPLIVVAILCCPPTGIAALILGLKGRRLWKEAPEGEAGAEQRRESHACAASARMWSGISYFVALIIWSAILLR